ncbi:hypothetical protein RHSIM_Rhsim09G0202100 [Rhododendron simsii]|uniref:CCHC-type domain-containing protein n=1 Tax=Rhododendron simsii TaxID=118357 RepID=A0A834LCY3_RHOSS|nr:hypothetical protein RHSIM_Rhsim09G0202100 [Rhododendron simsii]
MRTRLRRRAGLEFSTRLGGAPHSVAPEFEKPSGCPPDNGIPTWGEGLEEEGFPHGFGPGRGCCSVSGEGVGSCEKGYHDLGMRREKGNPPPSFKDALISVSTTTSRMEKVPEILEQHDPAHEVDADGIPTISISNEDLDRIRKPWATSIIIRVIGRSFGHEFLLSKLLTLWKPSDKMTCLDLGDHFVLVRFQSPSDMIKVLNEGPWFIGPHYITIRKWEPEFDTSKAKISTSVIWVRLPGLPIEFYDKEMLLKIGAKIGKLLKIDFRTENNEKVKFAHLCVQVDLSSSLISKVRVGNHVQKVSYEGIPIICFKCGLSGHKLQHCSPAPSVVTRTPPSAQDAKFGEWMLVTNRNRGKKKLNPPSKETPKPVNGTSQNQWRGPPRNPRLGDSRVSNSNSNGASSSGQVSTKPTPSPNPTPVTPPPNIPCPVTIHQPLTSPKLLLNSLPPPVALDAAALPSAPILPDNASSLAETLFAPNGSLLLSDKKNQPIQSPLCPSNIISPSSPSRSKPSPPPVVSNPKSTTPHHDPSHQPQVALPPAPSQPSPPAPIPSLRTSNSVQNSSPGKSVSSRILEITSCLRLIVAVMI